MRARTLRNAAAAVVLTAAVAVAGTGCGSGEDPAPDRGPAPGAASPSPDASAAGPGDGEPTREKREKEGKGGAAEQPTVPKAELTPATGSFTEKQKEYLVERVPEGYEPAAVLEAGQAACQRIGRTAKVDRKAAVGALRSGEIADAKDAVLHLCPKHKPLLQAAGLLD